MKYVWAFGILAAAAVSTGCNTNPPQVAQVPPPPALVSAPADIIVPVQVEDPAASANTGLQVPASQQQVQFNEPAPQPTYIAPEPAPVSAQPSIYTIKDGDNLWQIAKKVYGDGQKWVDIKAANPGLNENRLIPGKKINLP